MKNAQLVVIERSLELVFGYSMMMMMLVAMMVMENLNLFYYHLSLCYIMNLHPMIGLKEIAIN
jgi:hypothetical protein